jgi:hypothetical protein
MEETAYYLKQTAKQCREQAKGADTEQERDRWLAMAHLLSIQAQRLESAD